MISRRQLYALGEPFGDSATQEKPFGRTYGSGGGGGQNSTTVQSIPDELKPLASAYTSKAINLSNQGYQPYDGQRVADMNQFQSAGANAIASRALGGSDLMDAASARMQGALSSGQAATSNPYAGSNPYLQQNIDAALGDVTRNYNNAIAPGLTTAGVSSGSFGNTGVQAQQQEAMRNLSQELGRVSSGMRMQDYTTQQQLGEQFASRNDAALQNMLGLSPTYGNQAYTDAAQLMKVGQQYQDQSQQVLDTGYQNYLDQQNLPYKQLAAMSGVFGSNLGATSTTSSSGGGK